MVEALLTSGTGVIYDFITLVKHSVYQGEGCVGVLEGIQLDNFIVTYNKAQFAGLCNDISYYATANLWFL